MRPMRMAGGSEAVRPCPATCPDVSGNTWLIWFIVWLIASNIGSHEPLLLNPFNAWTATLILAIALDLGAAYARGGQRRRE